MTDDPIDMKALGLKPREMQVLQYALAAYRFVPNGHYLTSPGQRRAAERLIARKFLTKAKHKFIPPVDWLVVVLTKRNITAMKQALKTEAA
jgi:hypothetical protein